MFPKDNRRMEAETKESPAAVKIAVNTAISLSFLALAAYIGFFFPHAAGTSGLEPRHVAVLVGAYGIWRLIRTVLMQQDRKETETGGSR
jgi:hypothetical protein